MINNQWLLFALFLVGLLKDMVCVFFVGLPTAQPRPQVWPLLGRHLITKGPQGLLSLGKFVPFVGSAVGAVAGSAVDWIFCHQTIQWADEWVFRLILKEEEELRAFLQENHFEDEAEILVNQHHFDVESICDVGKDDLRGLELPLGRVMKLIKRLHSAEGPCSNKEPSTELWCSEKAIK